MVSGSRQQNLLDLTTNCKFLNRCLYAERLHSRRSVAAAVHSGTGAYTVSRMYSWKASSLVGLAPWGLEPETCWDFRCRPTLLREIPKRHAVT